MPKRVLFLAGGWDGHQPQQVAAFVAGLLEQEGCQAIIADTLDVLLDAAALATYDLIVPVWSTGKISPEQVANLEAAVISGVGLGGFHGGMGDAFRESTEYQFMTGGQFVAHPGNHIDYTVNIINHDHPVTASIPDFQMHSEQYYMHVDPANHVLATTTFSADHAPWIGGTVMPVIWTRQHGAARVFFCSLGHDMRDFEVPEMREIIRRGLLWAAR